MDHTAARATFSIVGRSFDLETISGLMGMVPDHTTFEHPIVTVDGPTIGHDIETSWSLRTPMIECTDINVPLSALLDILRPKQQIIRQIVECFSLSCVVAVDVDVGAEGVPVFNLSLSTIDLLHSIRAPINFDVFPDFCAENIWEKDGTERSFQ